MKQFPTRGGGVFQGFGHKWNVEVGIQQRGVSSVPPALVPIEDMFIKKANIAHAALLVWGMVKD